MSNREKDDLVGLPPELVRLVKDITNAYDKEDKLERDERRPLWMKLENYFNGLQRLYWNMTAKDWRIIDEDESASRRHYDKVENIYRPHGESIIAALSIKPPSAIFYPDDAEIEEDVTTAKACVKLKENLERINHAKLKIIKSLMILFNQGTVASYIYNDKNSKYGTYTVPEIAEEPDKLYTKLLNCTECGSNIDERTGYNESVKVEEEVRECPTCGYKGIPNQEEYEEVVPKIIGSTIQKKYKTCIEVFSPLFVYVPFYAREQEHIPYLRMRFEQHYSALKNHYPKLKKKGFSPTVDHLNAEERGIQIGVNNFNLATVDCWWIRDWGFDVIDGKDEDIKKLKKLYPDGFYAVFVDDQLVEIHNENLDEHWHISQNPLSTYIHGEPIGKPLAPIQDMKNEVNDLQIETFEHAIPETHARADVVDFKKYGKSKAQPGMLYPAIPPTDGQPLGNAFHTIKTATLSEENDIFNKRLDNSGQFVVGSFPSIYGGPATSGSKTAREYTESRAMALQRLGLTWDILKFFWAGTMSKAIPLYIHALKKMGLDEKIVEKTTTGFVNTWIRQTDIEGKVGSIEADADEGLPLSPAQLKDVVLQLMTLKDEFVSAALYHPQNTPILTKALGAPDFYIPGSDSRNKQYSEFTDLLNGIPVEVNPTTDDHRIEGETCLAFLNSPTVLMLRKVNPEGVKAIEDHYIMHLEAEKMKAPAGPETVNSETGVENA